MKMLFATLVFLLGLSVSTPVPQRIGPPKNAPSRQMIQRRIRELRSSSITIPSDFFFGKARSLQEYQYNSSMCSICKGARILTSKVPGYDADDDLPPNITCGEWEYFAQATQTVEECDATTRFFYWQCCVGGVPVYQCESNIRQKILQNYDPAVPPIVSPESPLDVTVTLEPHAVEKIDVQAGTAKILCSLHLVWKDERLKWDLEEDTCAGYVSLWSGSDREKTEIWVPDIDLYNQVQGVQTFPDTSALVYNDGSVIWNRLGGITAFCQFSGLSQIPFDVLGCQFIVGPWVRQDPSQIKYHLFNGTGLVQGKFQATFNEYLPVPELSESGIAFEDTILYFNLYYKRSQKYYVNNLLVPTIILTYVSMGTFLLDLRVGERLSYGMALTLVVVAQQIATGGTIPISNERLWIDKFIGWSFYWVIVGLVESVIIGYIYFLREDKAAQLSPGGGNRIYDGMQASVYAAQPGSKSGEEEDHDRDKDAPFHNPSKRGNYSSNEQVTDVVDCDNSASYLDMLKARPTQHTQSISADNGPGQFTTLKQQLQRSSSVEETDLPAVGPGQQTIVGAWKWVYTISLRKIDRFFFFFTLVTYTLFVIAMFISRPYWGRNLENVWLNESATSWDKE
ncbi:receptor subunit alpha-type acr-16 [Seminavis robusta]|uniref:Receptor subunit alpha-type acr-16 n=1 Tax=Seminavis robusta TaxID=568900 RepID=A0A9N8DZY1_9STRA|nr:receptor subunit alpha-type acr-16 [Seminavis robusta]|eukprot:Sro400_g135050.1 receptor subunit alpha-type acr-16 (623) ;mRNA; r:18255-20216